MGPKHAYAVLGERILQTDNLNNLTDLDVPDGQAENYTKAMKILADNLQKAPSGLNLYKDEDSFEPLVHDSVIDFDLPKFFVFILVDGKWYVCHPFILVSDALGEKKTAELYYSTGDSLVSYTSNAKINHNSIKANGILPEKAVFFYDNLDGGHDHGSLADFGG